MTWCRGIWLIALIVTAPAENPSPPKQTEISTEDDYAISSTALADLFEKQKPDQILLLDQTSIGFPPGMAAIDTIGNRSSG
jgi:hypothetical protein